MISYFFGNLEAFMACLKAFINVNSIATFKSLFTNPNSLIITDSQKKKTNNKR